MNKSYVIRKGHFTEAQKKAYDSLSAGLLIPVTAEGTSETIDFTKIFNNTNGVTLEIGFGMGITTAIIAEVNPDRNYLGVEVHKPGIGRLLWEIEQRSLSNIRIVEYDAVYVAEKMIRQGSLDAIHVFFPDPWPKKKHRKRRLMQRPFTELLANCLKSGGYLYMATDWEDYALHALEELSACTVLKNAYEGFAAPLTWRPQTNFEKKGLAKSHEIRELYFTRI